MQKRKTRCIRLAMQAANLRSKYPSGQLTLNRDQSFIWRGSLTPSPMGGTYELKVRLHVKDGVKVWGTAPKSLSLAPGKLSLPHVYDSEKQLLCLYYPKDNEWDRYMFLGDTILPWAIEWLYHYEIWVINGGKWTGGGIHPSS